MAGKKKHAMRSRKTAKARLRAARLYLCQRPAPVWMRRIMDSLSNY